MDRRAFLSLGAVVGVTGLAGCTGRAEPGPPSASPRPSGDDALRRAAVDSEAALVALYRDAIAESPGELGAALTVLRDQHVEHGARLRPGSALAPTPEAGSSTGTGASEAPRTSRQILTSLLAAERAAVRQRQEACDRAETPDLARVLALVAASEAQHAAVLRDLRATGQV